MSSAGAGSSRFFRASDSPLTYYDVLEIDRAGLEGMTTLDIQKIIKKQRNKLSKAAHPDKGGSDEQQAAINMAFVVLSNPTERLAYDAQLGEPEESKPDGPIFSLSSTGHPLSLHYRQQHQNIATSSRADYQTDRWADQLTQAYSGQSFSQWYVPKCAASAALDLSQKMTPDKAIYHLKGLVNKDYSFSELQILSRHFKATAEARKQALDAKGAAFYGALTQLFMGISTPTASVGPLLDLLGKITDHFSYLAQLGQSCTEAYQLFNSPNFKSLMSFVREKFWVDEEPTSKILDHLTSDSREELAQLISGIPWNGHARRLLQLLFAFDEQLNMPLPSAGGAKQSPASVEREKAFRAIDWFKALSPLVKKEMRVNLIFLVGVYFNKAATLESDRKLINADQNLAFLFYMQAWQLAKKTTSDIELVIGTHILKLCGSWTTYLFKQEERYASIILQDNFAKPLLDEIQQRVVYLAGQFPFYQRPQNRVEQFIGLLPPQLKRCLQDAYPTRSMLPLMASCLNASLQDPRTVNTPTLLYHVVKAFYKGWYSHGDAVFATKIKFILIKDLLARRSIKVEYLVQSLGFPDGDFLRPEEPVALPAEENYYSQLNGFEIDWSQENPQLVLMGQQWNQEDDPRERLLCSSDFIVLINLMQVSATSRYSSDSAIEDPQFAFSLDPLAPDSLEDDEKQMNLHPLQTQRIEPEQLMGTTIHQAQLHSDLLLKYLMTGGMLQGTPPFGVKSVDELLLKMSPRLQKIFQAYYRLKQDGDEEVHRFWFEPNSVSVVNTQDNYSRLASVAVEDAQMTIKTHPMQKNLGGELHDAENHYEGWHLYFASPSER